MFSITIEPILTPVAGQSTVEIAASHPVKGSFRSEFERKHEAAVVAYLDAEGYQHITATYWVHSWNRHGCKPDVVANTCGLTVWKQEGQPLGARAVDIWEGY